jgi:predicted nucleic acid-binding Zn ribbon protein
MPTVDYKCECGDETTEFYSLHEDKPETLKCGKCGEARRRMWAGKSPSIGMVPGAGGSPSRGSL